ncbi:hypothetical protein C9374_011553 [Naegleria lovaniensis]|uniref:Lipid-binding serum glycoprotein C-terminal domain-containing protein n=1 Tax=Naegleria lovaniensis TaxID=51637 RepID=A0AA88KP55_NAELO|nr:uncharacterized protein C9374_011553 [Naegleria lovaniensis]KAG2392828.1 hypothetical protein C9374_011553 [Naegleria lovaniensis]
MNSSRLIFAAIALLVALLITTTTVVNGQLSTVRAFLSDSDLNTLLTKEAPLFAQEIEAQKIPDMQLKEHVSLIGDVDISITGITLSNVGLGNLQVGMTSPNQVSLTDNNAQITISLNWAYRQESWPHSSGSGTAVCSTNTVSMAVTILMQLDVNTGKPQFQLTTNTIDLGTLNINISGGGGWILSLLQNLFSSQIKSSIETGVESAISSAVANVNNNIQAANMMPVLNMTLGANNFKLQVDYRLTELTVLNNAFLAVGTRATFYDPNKGISPLPFGHVTLPNQPPSQIDDLIDAYATDFVINSMLYGLYSSNQMQTIVTPDMVPNYSPIQLNTTSLKTLIPQLYNAYPNKQVQLYLYSNAASNANMWPNIKISQSNGGMITAYFYGNIEFQVLTGSGSVTNAFILSLVANATLDNPKLIVSGGSKLNFTAQIVNPQFSVSVAQSWIGPVNVANLQQVIQLTLIDIYLPILNKDLASGIQLIDFSSLLPGFNLVNPNLLLQNGYMIMGVDGYYSPSLLLRQQSGKNFESAEKIIAKLKKTISIQ